MSKPRIVCISQARMGSERLPGKVMRAVRGRPLLAYHVERLRAAHSLDAVVVATTVSPRDDVIVELCRSLETPVFRGSEADVLARYTRCAQFTDADIVVRVTSDCPLIDPQLLDAVVDLFLTARPEVDCALLNVHRFFPRGLDVEVLSRSTLERLDAEATEPLDREHVTRFIHRQPERFRVATLGHDRDLTQHRWCVDEAGDYALVSRIIEHLHPIDSRFSWLDCLRLATRHPEWAALNRHVVQRS